MKKLPLLSLLVVSLLCILSACDATNSTKTPKQVTPLNAHDILQKCVQAMQMIHSLHFSVNTYDVEHSVEFHYYVVTNTQYNGDDAGDQFKTDITVQGSSQKGTQQDAESDAHTAAVVHSSSVITQGKVYILNNSGKWIFLDQSKISQYLAFLWLVDTRSFVLNLILKTSLEKASLQNLGEEMMSRQALRHIHVTFGLSDYENLLLQSDVMYNEHLDRQSPYTGTYDFWIDEGTGYLHRMTEKWDMTTFDPNDTSRPNYTSSTGNETATLTNFNIPVIITPPNNASPAQGPQDLS